MTSEASRRSSGSSTTDTPSQTERESNAMTTSYTIYLVNNSMSTQVFWLFLAPPEELSTPDVFANSSTSLAVPANSPATNTFTVPVQYVVGAGASNNAVGLNVVISSTISQNTDLQQGWQATYADAPPNMGPTLLAGSAPANKDQIAIASNGFNQASNEANGWFSSMSYGVKTSQGFAGMTWSPSPAQTRTLTPLLQFYVAVGTFQANSLAAWTDVSNTSAQLDVPSSFLQNKCTVTYTATVGWTVTPGAPSTHRSLESGESAMAHSLIQSHQLLSGAHADLVDILHSMAGHEAGHDSDSRLLGAATNQEDKIV